MMTAAVGTIGLPRQAAYCSASLRSSIITGAILMADRGFSAQ